MKATFGEHAQLSARDIGNVGEAALFEDADSQMRTKTGPTVHNDPPVLGQTLKLEAKVVYRKVQRTDEMRLLVFAQGPNIQNDRRLGPCEFDLELRRRHERAEIRKDR